MEVVEEYDEEAAKRENEWSVKNPFFFGEKPTKEDIREIASKAVSKLRCDLALTETKVKVFMELCDQILSSYQRFSVGLVANFLASTGMNKNETSRTLIDDLEISNIFEDVSNPMMNLSYLSGKVKRSLPEPVEIELGVRKISRTTRYQTGNKTRCHKFTSVQKVSKIKDRMNYVPIKDTLALIFSNPDAREMLQQEHGSTDSVMRGFKDGSLFSNLEFCRNHPFGIRLVLHIDDVEYCNPLGSRRGKHKLTIITFKIQNFNPKINSGLDRVYVALVVPSKCVKKYGFARILKPMLQDLMALESQSGILIPINATDNFTLRASVVHVLGDTAAFHELFELMPAQSNIFCRACYISRCSLHAGNFGLHHQLRTRESVTNDLLALQNGTSTPAKCGIIQAPALHVLRNFHFTENLTFDPMHDVLEGVVSMVLKKILNDYVNVKKLITEHILNKRIESFDYGLAEVKDKPSANFTAKSLKSKNNSISQSASQIWLLLRAFNFIFADIAQSNYLEIVSCLLKITFYAFSNVLTYEQINDLDSTITRFYYNYKLCFPLTKPINKVHHLAHYPTVIRQSGPIVNMACLQFEAKYKELKSLTKTCGNFQNLTYSLAKRINFKQTAKIIDHDYEVDQAIVKSSTVTQKKNLECSFLLFDFPEDVENVQCMTINGVTFRPGLVVKYQTCNDQSYGILNNILRMNEQFTVIIQVLNVIELCESLLSYKAEILNQTIRTSLHKISTKKCYSLWRLCNTNDEYLYISMKYND